MRTFLRAYEMVPFDEARMCPNPACHGLHGIEVQPTPPTPLVGGTTGAAAGAAADAADAACVVCADGAFAVEMGGFRGQHSCESEGCFHFLGFGHSREAPLLKGKATDAKGQCGDGGEDASVAQYCGRCGRKPDFSLRAASGATSA